MKKLFIILLLLSLLAGTVSAITPPNTNMISSQVVTEGINNYSNDQAEMLKKLGLFSGTDKGFELVRGMTRAEAAVMLVRFLGEEKTTVTSEHKHPFTDVPEWADRYVGWLYENKLTSGISATEFGSGQLVTYQQYATFLSRACAGNDDYFANGIGNPSEQELSEGNNMFFRQDAVGLSTRALQWTYTRDGYGVTMAQHLIQKGVFSVEQWLDAAVNVFPIYYDYRSDGVLIANIAGVQVQESAVAGLSGHTAVEIFISNHCC